MQRSVRREVISSICRKDSAARARLGRAYIMVAVIASQTLWENQHSQE
jgi:hypothetical protein